MFDCASLCWPEFGATTEDYEDVLAFYEMYDDGSSSAERNRPSRNNSNNDVTDSSSGSGNGSESSVALFIG